MIVLDIAIAGCVITLALAAWRIAIGPTPADRAVAADLFTFTVVGLFILAGTRLESQGTYDLMIAATLVAFLAAVSLARALTGGRR